MRWVYLMMMYFSINAVEPQCITSREIPDISCNHGLEESPNGIGAGSARNLTANCIYDRRSDMCHYQFSWKPPEPTGTPVSKYRIMITYRLSTQVCFLVPPSQTTFIFNESIGLFYGCGFDLYVTALPIVYVDDSFQDHPILVYGCPVIPKLLPLPNIIAKGGSSYSFVARFVHEPIPIPIIKWYFTADKVYCKNLSLIRNDIKGVFTSKNMRVLTIENISKAHIGCYVAKANNTIGRIDEQRGYLDLNSSSLSHWTSKRYSTADIEGPLFGSLAGIMIALLFLLLILMYKRKRRFLPAYPEERLLSKKVYVSHCAHGEKESATLTRFVNDLKTFGIDVIVDIFSQVEINTAGGMSRWVQTNIVKADKIVVFITENYLTALKTTNIDESLNENSDFVCKVHCEFNYVNGLVYSSLSNSRDNIIVVSKTNIAKEDLLLTLPDRPVYKFDRPKDKDFKSFIDMLSR